MKYSIAVKFLTIVLCACALVTMVFSGTGIAFMEGYNLYREPLGSKQGEQMEMVASTIANQHARMYVTSTLSNVPEEVLLDIGYSHGYPYNYGGYLVDIYEDGQLVSSEGVNFDENTERGECFQYQETVCPHYPVVTSKYIIGENGKVIQEPQAEAPAETGTATEESRKEAPTEEGVAPASETPTGDVLKKVDSTLKIVDEALARVAGKEAVYSEEYNSGWRYDEEKGHGYETVYNINYYEGPEYEVRVYLEQDAMIGADFRLLTVLYPYRDYFIPMLLAGLVAFAICFVFLCTLAGRNKNGEVKLAAINRIPLDLYTVVMGGLSVALVMPMVLLFESAYWDNTATIWDNPKLCLLICCLCGVGIALCIIGLLYAFAAQVKASDNYWLRHTVIGWCVRQMGKLLGLAGRGFGFLGRGIGAVGKGVKTAGRGIRAVFLMLPTIWQWIVTAFLMVVVPVIFLFFTVIAWHDFWIFLWGFLFVGCIAADVAIVCYGGWCFGTLLKGIETMSSGNLNYQISTRFLYGTFRDFAVRLNSLAGAAQTAADQRMKSERMKTELITNVSHDIKTPLTSIINFVDLMKKPHTEEEGTEYLAVLDRQSQRLKKLIDDLMDMSKASSGTMGVTLTRIDAVEAVNQALGEFADKLEKARLTPVFRHPEEPVIMEADGKHLWRILSNVLGNAVKYALPDTRLYVDLMVLQGKAVLAIKNISREQLNVNAEELMERFVRGDASRNTEGSGLGLNIAKSLVELQGGQMELTVDGDLFKVTMVFPLG